MSEPERREPREVWRIGDLTLDVGQQRLWRDGAEIVLPKLSFEFLLALARRAPDVVTYDELMDRVWPGLVVSPETIVQRVRLLRTAIGDDAAEPRYVEALRSRGYRLVAAAARAAPSELPGAAVDPAPSFKPSPPPSLLPAPATAMPRTPHGLIVAAVLAVLAVLTIAVLTRRGAMTPSARTAATVTTAEPGAAPVEAAARAARTVAVLPFENLSADPADAFIALAVPESTLDRLSGLRGLTVIARDSALRAGRAGLSASETGERLGAGWLVQGSVQRAGERVRVSARLIAARQDAQVWAARYERPIAELPALQDEIAAAVTDALAARLAGLQRAEQAQAYSRNLDASLAYLRGRALLDRQTVAGSESAAAHFTEAIERDAGFGAAYAALYDARMQAASLRRIGVAEARRQHAPLIERALALDPRCGAAYLARARWSDAPAGEREADFRRGLELEPSNARGIDGYAQFLQQQRRSAESARWLERELVVDPLSSAAHFRRAMQTLSPSGAGVERAMLGVLERDPTFYPALQRYAKYRWLLNGEIAQAIGLIEQAVASDPDNPWGRYMAAVFYLDAGDPAAARDVAAGAPVSAASLRTLLALYEAREADAALAALEDPAAFNEVESWGVPEALRDAALRAGAPPGSEPERRLVQRFASVGRAPSSGGRTNIAAADRIVLGNYRARILLAQLRLARGEREGATAELRALLAWMDANERFGLHHHPRAQVLMLLGDPDRALAELAASFAEDRDYRQWWYTLGSDPTWAPVRADPRFRAIGDAARAHVRRERATLDALRRDGKVPPRGAAPGVVGTAATIPYARDG